MAYELIETLEVTNASGVASIQFSTIPQTGAELLLVCSPRSNNSGNATSLGIRFNGDSGANYDRRNLRGEPSGTITQTSFGSNNLSISSPVVSASATANTFGNIEIRIANYTSNSDKAISVDSVGANDSTANFASFQTITSGIYSNTTPITSVEFSVSTDNFLQYTTASLYIIS